MTGFLTEAERQRVQALFAEILPSGPRAPGATEAGAVDFVDRILAEGAYHEVAKWREAYRTNLPTATTAAQVASDNPAFFALLRDHCIEGCFADPRWGGNKDGVMWRWYGYPGTGHA